MLWSQPHPQKRCSSVVSRVIFSPAVKLFGPCGLLRRGDWPDGGLGSFCILTSHYWGGRTRCDPQTPESCSSHCLDQKVALDWQDRPALRPLHHRHPLWVGRCCSWEGVGDFWWCFPVANPHPVGQWGCRSSTSESRAFAFSEAIAWEERGSEFPATKTQNRFWLHHHQVNYAVVSNMEPRHSTVWQTQALTRTLRHTYQR